MILNENDSHYYYCTDSEAHEDTDRQMNQPHKFRSDCDVVVVGAGASGIGVSVTLRHAGVTDVLVLDRHEVGASFTSWPDETRFITPSFPSNSVGMLDLNSVAIGTSPAVTLQSEHPNGKQYAEYLKRLAEYFELPVVSNTEVTNVRKTRDQFQVETSKGTVRTKHVIWAAGEFQYPLTVDIPGSEYCRHTATIGRYKELKGENIIVIGGYESGVDAAFHLAANGKQVQLFDSGCPWASTTSDPSVSLSTYSLERMTDQRFVDNVELQPYTRIAAIQPDGDKYRVATLDGIQFSTDSAPLLAVGFKGSQHLVKGLFEQRQDGFPLLTENDESTTTTGLFLCGPAVRHGNQSFCFIYKYRQRFAVVAKAVATSLGLPASELETYRMWGMYLDDLSCCGQECVC